ncbi:uncharacterized protein TRIADDRAFT_55493 [Trichoplax adhaerens]|uniref:Large ribosomal subunit protein mL46 n=1 Tax=Trichoplax adhaerens TaxID=10228 RepID=B3RV16_TRIAD|nr:hypothetical protein TRIADDRAFT_55493 [Trichoplax adhaerens]EDV25920.1 hypothetical protein TRIADDRAFT_55493 [Trichoplax adhaerens]|eukprot:XP_002111953.1 hypothetical protein TRIADDRAFT_55493 [Trichoplax adhaerens]
MATSQCYSCISRRLKPSPLRAAFMGILGNRLSTTGLKSNQQLQPKVKGKSSLQQNWRLVSAICVERLPVISSSTNSLETRVQELFNTIEEEKSVISDYEIDLKNRKAASLDRLKALDSGMKSKELQELAREEIESELQELEEEAKSFQAASRTTQADEEDDRKSLDRKLAESLYLLVKKSRHQHAWQMPQGQHEGEESLRQTAERELKEECGEQLTVKFLSNAPSALYTYKFHKDYQSDHVGAKVFFYKTFYNEGQIVLNTEELEDYAWVTGQEMQDYVTPEYYRFLSKFLYLPRRENDTELID